MTEKIGPLAKIALLWMVVCGLACNAKVIGGTNQDAFGYVGYDAAAAAICECGSGDPNGLRVSFSCYCAKYGCSEPPALCGPSGVQSWRLACGLILVNVTGALWVYDSAGQMVGVRRTSDTPEYVCPSDSELKSFDIMAGQIPDAGCPTTSCTCDAGGACAWQRDAGARD